MLPEVPSTGDVARPKELSSLQTRLHRALAQYANTFVFCSGSGCGGGAGTMSGVIRSLPSPVRSLYSSELILLLVLE
jgi:hypothetical protein